MKASFASPLPLFLFRLRQTLLFGFRLGVLGLTQPRAAEDVAQRVVAFVARVLVEMILGDRPGIFAGPRLIPGLRILDCEPVLQRVRARARETLRDLEVLGRAAEAGLVGEVRRLDDERVAFPMPHRVAEPLADR